MNSVGIDISKGRSMVAVMRPFGEVVISPFEVRHTDSELSELARQLKSLNGETRVVMEATGNYHAPVAKLLHYAGLYVSAVSYTHLDVYKRQGGTFGYKFSPTNEALIGAAVKPGPAPITSGAISCLVPRFFFAKIKSATANGRNASIPVSYTHLDVYKRQPPISPASSNSSF